MESNSSENLNQHQIIRKDSRNCFVETQSDWFASGKVHMQFVSYDKNQPKGQRATNSIHIYIDVSEFILLAAEAASGMLHRRMQAAKEKRSTEPLYECLGGTSAERLRQFNQQRADGKSLSRIAKLIAGEKTDYLFIADSGPGETDAQGLIVPKFGRNPEQHVSVSLSWRHLSELLLTTQIHYSAWLSAQYAKAAAAPVDRRASRTDAKPTQQRSAPPHASTPPPPAAPPAGEKRKNQVRQNGRENGKVDADDMRFF